MTLLEKRSAYLLLIIFVFSYFNSRANELNFTGNKLPVIELIPEKNTGLDFIYVINDVQGVNLSFSPSNTSSSVEWLEFSNLGGGYAQEIKDIVKENGQYILKNLQGDRGYIIRTSEESLSFWVVDYSQHKFEPLKLSGSSEQECEETILDFEGNASPIYYYTINGKQEILSRELKLQYMNLEWNESFNNFTSVPVIKILSSCSDRIVLTPPLYCSSVFTLSGDQFLEEWGLTSQVTSPTVSTISVNVVTDAQQDQTSSEDSSNQISTGSDALGGSAPATINFTAYVTDEVVHYEWQIAEDENFDYLLYRFNEQDLSYTFNEEGTRYVRFVGSNSTGSCEAYGDTYTISIGASELLVPNAFSPNDDGVNDIWKVSYRSLTEFKCWIFDRHGHQIFYFEDPNSGWDGKKNGKTVTPGVYFYVIQAKGADGIKYKKSGDINILNYKSFSDYKE